MNESAPQVPNEDTKQDELFSPELLLPAQTVEAAAIRPTGTKSEISIETVRQMGIAAADRANREAAGLAPRVHDLK